MPKDFRDLNFRTREIWTPSLYTVEIPGTTKPTDTFGTLASKVTSNHKIKIRCSYFVQKQVSQFRTESTLLSRSALVVDVSLDQMAVGVCKRNRREFKNMPEHFGSSFELLFYSL